MKTLADDFFESRPAGRSVRSRNPIYGVGFNDANYEVNVRVDGKNFRCPYYTRWTQMLERCYSSAYQSKAPTYADCTVCDDWLHFTLFKSWMKKQDWQGKELDKDLLVQGNKKYSPDTCLFVTSDINLLIGDCESVRGKYPRGVNLDKLSNKFKASVSINGKRKHLGLFFTVHEASYAYKKAKYKNIEAIALKQKEPLKTALLNYII